MRDISPYMIQSQGFPSLTAIRSVEEKKKYGQIENLFMRSSKGVN